MRASEMIEILKEMIEEKGDLEVCVKAGDLTMVVTRVDPVKIEEMRSEGALKMEYVLLN